MISIAIEQSSRCSECDSRKREKGSLTCSGNRKEKGAYLISKAKTEIMSTEKAGEIRISI